MTEVEGVLHYQDLPYLPEIIKTEIISKHHDNLLVDHFGIKKTWGLVAQKYYCPTLRVNIETYMKGCDVCVAFKAVKHKLYGDLQLLLVSTHH